MLLLIFDLPLVINMIGIIVLCTVRLGHPCVESVDREGILTFPWVVEKVILRSTVGLKH